MSMTLDEMIQHCKNVSRYSRENIKRLNENIYIPSSIDKEQLCEMELCCAKEHEQLAEWLEELKELREKTRWIPVSERLPEEDGCYFISYHDDSVSDDFVGITHYKPTRVEPFEAPWFWDYDIHHITAWMPLPEPYKSDGEGET